EHRVEVALGELDFLVAACARLRDEHDVERLVDMGRDRFTGRNAALVKRGLEPAGHPNPLALAGEDGMRLEPLQRLQAEPTGERGALLVRGDDVEPVTVANLVNLHQVAEFAHATWPPITSRSPKPASPSSRRFSA